MTEQKEKSKLMRGVSTLVTIMLILAVLLCVYIVFQVVNNGHVSFGGYRVFRVVTDSMEPTMSVGALLVAQETDIQSVETGDIVCFHSYDANIYGSVVTHRVVSVIESSKGLWLETKGDNNMAVDGYYVTADNFVGKVIWFTGENNVLTSIFSFFTNKIGFLGCVVFPCLLIAGIVLQSCVKNIRSEMEEAKKEAEQASKQEAASASDMSPEEYAAMVARIRDELIAELTQRPTESEGEHHVGILEEEQTDTIK